MKDVLLTLSVLLFLVFLSSWATGSIKDLIGGFLPFVIFGTCCIVGLGIALLIYAGVEQADAGLLGIALLGFVGFVTLMVVVFLITKYIMGF